MYKHMELKIEKLKKLTFVNVTWFLHISKSGEDCKKFKKHNCFIINIICNILFCKADPYPNN